MVNKHSQTKSNSCSHHLALWNKSSLHSLTVSPKWLVNSTLVSNSNRYNNAKVDEILSIHNRNNINNSLKQQVYAKVATKLEIFKSHNNNIKSVHQAKRTYIKCTLIMVLLKQRRLAAKYKYRILRVMVRWEWFQFRVNQIWSSKPLNSSNFRSYLKLALQLQDQLHLFILYPQLISQTTQDRTQQVMLSRIEPALVIVRSVRSHWVWQPTPSPLSRISSNNNSSSSSKTLVTFSRWRDRPQPALRASWQEANSRRLKK